MNYDFPVQRLLSYNWVSKNQNHHRRGGGKVREGVKIIIFMTGKSDPF
jgi:hypothetical protein